MHVIVKVIVTKNDIRITRKKVKAAIIKTVIIKSLFPLILGFCSSILKGSLIEFVVTLCRAYYFKIVMKKGIIIISL